MKSTVVYFLDWTMKSTVAYFLDLAPLSLFFLPFFSSFLAFPFPLQILTASLQCPPQVTQLTLANARLEEDKQALLHDLDALRRHDGEESRRLKEELDHSRGRVEYLEQLVIKYDKDLARRAKKVRREGKEREREGVGVGVGVGVGCP